MFSPTSFPAAAWRVTKALNVVPVTLHTWYHSFSGPVPGVYRSVCGSTFWAEDLFASREDAVATAVDKLAGDEARVARAIARHARRRAMVRKVLAGGAK